MGARAHSVQLAASHLIDHGVVMETKTASHANADIIRDEEHVTRVLHFRASMPPTRTVHDALPRPTSI